MLTFQNTDLMEAEKYGGRTTRTPALARRFAFQANSPPRRFTLPNQLEINQKCSRQDLNLRPRPSQSRVLSAELREHQIEHQMLKRMAGLTGVEPVLSLRQREMLTVTPQPHSCEIALALPKDWLLPLDLNQNGSSNSRPCCRYIREDHIYACIFVFLFCPERDSNSHPLLFERSGSASWPTRAILICALGETRTPTDRGLNSVPLPLGYEGIFCVSTFSVLRLPLKRFELPLVWF